MLNIVLLEPEIPQNTGNISRTCAATGTRLHLIEPLGFEISDRYLKRAGLDYWKYLDLTVYPGLDSFYKANPGAAPYMASTKAKNRYTDIRYKDGDWLMFGRETRGLPEDMLNDAPCRAIRIPMLSETRSLNLSNSVAIVLYESLRQLGFPAPGGDGVLK